MNDTQYTIQNVPDEVDQALRLRATQENKSLEVLLREVLAAAAERAAKPKLYHDLDFMFGSWVDDPEFDRAIKEFDVIDEEMWK